MSMADLAQMRAFLAAVVVVAVHQCVPSLFFAASENVVVVMVAALPEISDRFEWCQCVSAVVVEGEMTRQARRKGGW
jgi:hypothetical protein